VTIDAAFAAAMSGLGPFEPAPRLAAAVSGGADSMALALLAHKWVRQHCGSLLALVVDHRLRSESSREADQTVARLAGRGIAARVLAINGLHRGPALAERARAARSAALEACCAEAGILHLLLGHHAGDQAETLQIRALGGSGPAGMAGIAPLVETTRLRWLRPLLAIPPAQLRALLTATGVPWVEDPSNVDAAALRSRLRLLRRDHEGAGSATSALLAAAFASRRLRAEREAGIAASLSESVALRPEGFAILSGRPLSPPVLAAILQTIAGAPFPPSSRSVTALACSPRPATLAGVRLMPAGRLGPGLLAVREASAMAPAIPAGRGAVWDRRFRLDSAFPLPPEATLGALGDDAAHFRRHSSLPSAVLQTLPAVRLGSTLLAVPHLLYPAAKGNEHFPILFCPPRAAAAAPTGFGDA
jgi:tRNA(Ile)-lysidine synthase